MMSEYENKIVNFKIYITSLYVSKLFLFPFPSETAKNTWMWFENRFHYVFLYSFRILLLASGNTTAYCKNFTLFHISLSAKLFLQRSNHFLVMTCIISVKHNCLIWNRSRHQSDLFNISIYPSFVTWSLGMTLFDLKSVLCMMLLFKGFKGMHVTSRCNLQIFWRQISLKSNYWWWMRHCDELEKW